MERQFYRLNTEIWRGLAIEVHGTDDYDYYRPETVYINKRTKIKIWCNTCQKFFDQWPMNHINQNQGCPDCGKIKAQKREGNFKNHRKTTEEFKRDVYEKYSDKYEVLGEYINNKTEIKMWCHEKLKNGKEHGEFSGRPNDILSGHACKKCSYSQLEIEIDEFLTKNGIKFINGASKKDGFNWLGRQHLDFYLPDFNAAIECQGAQHFKPIDFGGGKEEAEKAFKKAIKNDNKKKSLCDNHGIKLFYYSDEINFFEELCKYKVFLDKNLLLEEIKNVSLKKEV